MSERDGGKDREAGGNVDSLLLEALLEVRRAADIIAEIIRGRPKSGEEVTHG